MGSWNPLTNKEANSARVIFPSGLNVPSGYPLIMPWSTIFTMEASAQCPAMSLMGLASPIGLQQANIKNNNVKIPTTLRFFKDLPPFPFFQQ
jgi:hypothetical protein